jgi:hypothetical protein
MLGAEAEGSAFNGSALPPAVAEVVLVAVPSKTPSTQPRPEPRGPPAARGVASAVQSLKSPTTDTALAFGAQTAKCVPPGIGMRAEDAPQAAVRALIEQVLVLLADEGIEFLLCGADRETS